MKRCTISLLLVLLTAGARAEYRTWTTTDGIAKPVEGEMLSTASGCVTVKRRNGRQLTIPLASLVPADQDFVARQVAEKAAAEKIKAAGLKLKESEMGKALSGRTVRLEGRSLRSYDLFAARAPEYYLIYWGASWCPVSRASAPRLAELYDTKIASASQIEFLLVSCDEDDAALKEFMKGMGFKFPAITREKAAKIKILSDLIPERIPAYKLLDATGKVLAEGEEARARAAELAAAAAKAATAH